MTLILYGCAAPEIGLCNALEKISGVKKINHQGKSIAYYIPSQTDVSMLKSSVNDAKNQQQQMKLEVDEGASTSDKLQHTQEEHLTTKRKLAEEEKQENKGDGKKPKLDHTTRKGKKKKNYTSTVTVKEWTVVPKNMEIILLTIEGVELLIPGTLRQIFKGEVHTGDLYQGASDEEAIISNYF